jgi:tRNA pseudouridine55 synthase
LNGLLLLDKPAGMTSHDAVDAVRRKFGMRRVGHAGTLDPSATGLLLVLVGAATKRAGTFTAVGKSYRVVMRCGVRTDTGDLDGRLVARQTVGPCPSDDRLTAVLRGLTGVQEQVPPMFSAVRVRGRRLYEWARRGIAVPRAARLIEVHALRLLAVRWPDVELEIDCSKGTYVRTLCEAIGEQLGYPASVVSLRRIRCGVFCVEEAISWEAFRQAPGDVLAGWLRSGEDPAWARCTLPAVA